MKRETAVSPPRETAETGFLKDVDFPNDTP